MSGADGDSNRADSALVEALSASQRLGILGAAPVAEVIDHSEAFVGALGDVSGTVVDLGSGGGIPGLVIAWRRPDLRLVLVDRRSTRTDHLHRLVVRLGLGGRVTVLTAEARSLPRLLPRPADAVVSRGFGTPTEVVATALPILVVGGLLVVSEPPAGPDRWSGLTGDDFTRETSDRRVAVLRRVPRGTPFGAAPEQHPTLAVRFRPRLPP